MSQFDGYHKWLGIPPNEQPPNHYRLLGVALFEDDADVIDSAANRQSAYLQQCASGKQIALSQKLLNEVAAARVCLLNPKKKKAYDAQLREKIEAAQAQQEAEENPLAFLNQAPAEFDPNAIELAPPTPRTAPTSAIPGWVVAIAVLLGVSVSAFLGYQLFLAKPEEPVVADSDEAREAANRSIINNSSKSDAAAPDDVVKRRTSTSGTPSVDKLTAKTDRQTDPDETDRKPRVGAPKLDTPTSNPSGIKELRNSLGMEFVFIPKGEFSMGSNDGSDVEQDERPRHRVMISHGFYLSKYETTIANYEDVMSPRRLRAPVTDKNRPVANKTWNEANQFCKRLSDQDSWHYRLPTEAEWEYACRAGTSTAWSFGDSLGELGDYAWFDASATGASQAVGTKKPNPWGLFDMHGNVGEWCYDAYSANTYATSRLEDPIGPAPEPRSTRIVRGGSCAQPPNSLRSAFRAGNTPGAASPRVGFRVLLEANVIGEVLTTSSPSHFSTLTHESPNTAVASTEPSSIPSETNSSKPSTDKTPPRPTNVPANAVYRQNSWYWFPDQMVPFKEALRIATSRKGRLVSISSEEENAFVTAHLHGTTLIGCAKVQNRWLSSAGHPQRYFNWATAQPSGGRGENYVAIHQDGMWHDYLEDTLYFAVEWGREE